MRASRASNFHYQRTESSGSLLSGLQQSELPAEMQAIMEQWTEDGCFADNTVKYLLLMLSKLALDIMVFYTCCPKVYTFFLNMCSLMILLVDLLVVFPIATAWFLGPDKSLSLCLVLANVSATYGALPIPMMILGLLNYFLEDASLYNKRSFCKVVRNAALALLVLLLAVAHKFSSTKVALKYQYNGTWTVMSVCKIAESSVMTYFVLGLFLAVICILLPFCTMIPRWVKEANKISIARENQEKKSSDLMFTQANCVDTKSIEKNYLEENDWVRPPLWLSLTLGFGLFWLPYLAVSVVFWLTGLAVPAYLTVNILWLECANSLIAGLVFWVKSKTQGPYSHLPENVCSWHVFWHLSKGKQQLQNPMPVFDPSKEKKSTLLCV